MNQLFYNIAGGIVHQIQLEKRTISEERAMSEVIVSGKQNFRCFSLFLPHLRTLTQEKRSQNCLRFGTGGPSVAIYNIFPHANNGCTRKKRFLAKRFAQTISVHYRDFEHAYLLNLIARLCQLCYKLSWLLLRVSFYLHCQGFTISPFS